MKRLLFALFLVGCPATQSYESFDAPVLSLDAEARDGRVALLAPRREALIEVDPATRSFVEIPVGRNPRVLIRPPGSDVLYTLDLGDDALSRVNANGDITTVDLGAPFNRVDWAPDGTRGIAWIDPAGESIAIDGSLNLNAYAVLTETGTDLTVTPGSLTFQPHEVTFSADSGTALIATTSRLHVIDLDAEVLSDLAVPFTTDESVRRTPDLVVPSPDGSRALVTVNGVADLFVLSLDPVLIENVIALPRTAQDIAFSFDGAQAIVADGTARVTFLDLQTFDTDELALGHGVNSILPSQRPENSFVMLYAQGSSSFITRADLTDGEGAPDEFDTFLLDDTVRDVSLEPGESAAVVFHNGGGFAGDFVPTSSLSLFSFEERAPSRILLDAAATDLIFLGDGVVPGSDDPHVFVVLEDSAKLVRYNLHDYSQVVFDTYDRPHSIGRIPPADGGSELLYVVHDQDLGLVSFVEPGAASAPPGGFPAVAGIAASGLLEDR